MYRPEVDAQAGPPQDDGELVACRQMRATQAVRLLLPPLGSASQTSTATVLDALDRPVLRAAPVLGSPAEEFSDRAQDDDGRELADDGSGPATVIVPLPSIPEVPVGDEEKGEPAMYGGGPADNRLLSDVAEHDLSF